MVDNNVIDLVQIDFHFEVLDELTAKLTVDGIDQNILLLTDQIAVVAGAFGGLVLGTVKVTNFPVTLANPVNVVFDMDAHNACSTMDN